MWRPKRVVAKVTLIISSTTPFPVALKHSLTEIEAHNFGEAFAPVTGFTGTGKHVTVFTRDSNLSIYAFTHYSSSPDSCCISKVELVFLILFGNANGKTHYLRSLYLIKE